MICAAYVRKSTQQSGVSDEEKSVARQVALCRAFAERQRWRLDDAHVFSDDAVSGAEFARRPGLVALLNALKPRPHFDVLLIYDADRLGREQVETSYVMKQINQAGVRIYETKGGGRELALDSPIDKMVMAVLAGAAEIERAKARERTRDALQRKAERGHVAGGCVFGYANRPVVDGVWRSHVERVIEPEEAVIVRRIFEMAATGAGFKRIAMALNDEGAVAPVPRRLGRPRGWSPSTVHDVIYRQLYRGAIVWGRRRKRDQWGQHRVQGVDEATWVRHQDEALRIVPEELWQAAHERLAAARAVYLKSTTGKVWGRPANSVESEYLLTGLASCGACGGSIFVHSHDHRPARRFFYGCMVYHLRGRSICKNNLEVPMESTDHAVLEAVERDVLCIEVFETALAKAMDAIRPPAEMADDRTRGVRVELARLDGEVARLAAAIAAGGEMAALVGALQERERRRVHLRAELAALDRSSRRPHHDMAAVLDQLRGHLTDWQGMLRQEPPAARLALRSLLGGRLIFTPRGDGADRYYEFEGPGTVSKIIAGLAPPKGVVTPAGPARFRLTVPLSSVYRRAA